jgi:SAM-dependent methyltransferase
MTDPRQASSLFDAYYYAHGCGSPVERSDEWLNMFAWIAGRIVDDLSPTTVLDAGCAWGFLVESLRQRGVEAWGVDISDYAIAQVHPTVKPFCWVGSVGDPFPQKYDLIVSIEVLEHLHRPESERALANLCQHSDDILFSSTPFDYKEVTHFNVQPPEYWAELFARQGFYRDMDFNATFISDWAARFTRMKETLPHLVYSYERKAWQLHKENVELRRLANQARTAQEPQPKPPADDPALKESQARLAESEQHLAEAAAAQQALQAQVAAWEGRWADLERGAGWKLLNRLQRLRLRLFPPGTRRERWFQALTQKSPSPLTTPGPEDSDRHS